MRTVYVLFAWFFLTAANNDPAYEEWREGLGATSVSLVYAAQFAGNPASYMGHLFLKVRSATRGRGRNQTLDLLDQTYGFVALVPEGTGSAAYALKGLLGGFHGGFVTNDFSELSYEYQSLESRDLWEYEIEFTDAEREHFLKRLWEMVHGGPYTYRFFDGNCAAMLGEMVWWTRPSIAENPGRPGLFTTPHDVIEWMGRHELIRSTKVWPSLRAQYLGRLSRISPADGELVSEDFAAARVTPGKDYLYYDALVARFDYEEAKEKAHLAPAPAAARDQALKLLAKAPLPATGQPVIAPETTDPRRGHPLTLAVLALGRTGESGFADLELRPAGHDLLDPKPGFSGDMGIAFVSGRVRYDGEAHTLRLRELDLMRMKNLAPFTALDRAPAWSFRAGVYDADDARFRRGYAGTTAGVGFSAAPANGLHTWVLPGGAARYALVEKRGEIAPRLEVGALVHAGEKVRLMATSETLKPYVLRGAWQEVERQATFGLAVSGAAATDVRAEIVAKPRRRTEAALALGRFF